MNFAHGLVASLAVLLAWTAHAGPVDCGSKPIRIGYFKLGYRYYIENGQEKGTNKDIVDELRKRTGCSIETQEMPFARVWSDLASGDLDISVSGIRSPERDKTLWCIPTIASKNYAVIRSELQSSVKSASDFLANPKLQFGVVRGYTHGEELDRWLAKLREAQRVEESASVEVLFEKIKLGRIDGFFAFPFVYRKVLADLGMEREVAVEDWAPGDKGITGCMMLTKNRFSEAEAARWQALIRQMREDGTLKRIFTRYMPPAEAEKMLDF